MGDKRSEFVSQKLLDSFYEKVADDVANNIQDKGVWVRAFAKAGGDEQKAKALYIELMVENMILEEEAWQELEAEKRLEKIKEINERERQEKEIENRQRQERVRIEKQKRAKEAEEWINSSDGKISTIIVTIPLAILWVYVCFTYLIWA